MEVITSESRKKRRYVFAHDTARKRAADDCMTLPAGWLCTFSEPNRNLDQNAAMWALLEEFSQQLQWPVNGQMVRLSSEDWKDLLTAGFRKETQPRLAAGIDGGIVMLGQRTSKFSKREMSEFLEFLHYIAADRGVVLEKEAA